MAVGVRFDTVSRVYGDVRAVDGVSLNVDAGEVVCLLGPSGCGKTTLLRLAAGIERPSSGSVLLNDAVVAGTQGQKEPRHRLRGGPSAGLPRIR